MGHKEEQGLLLEAIYLNTPKVTLCIFKITH